MKYISNPEIRLINLNANDVIATSAQLSMYNTEITSGNDFQVGARGYYDDEEEIW